MMPVMKKVPMTLNCAWLFLWQHLGGHCQLTLFSSWGVIQGHPARILIDSGSSHTFISESLAAKLEGISSFSPPLKVTVADGSQFFVPQSSRSSLGQFRTVNLFQWLRCYRCHHMNNELIVGMDWLASYSPMQIDWQHKWLLISQGQGQHLLQGSLTALPAGSIVQVSAILPDDTVDRQGPLPPEVSALLIEFQLVSPSQRL